MQAEYQDRIVQAIGDFYRAAGRKARRMGHGLSYKNRPCCNENRPDSRIEIQKVTE